ncbi:RNA-directed DNA polymerase from mobile element jockey-like [Rhizophagus irregularis DAOM 181602=DAOM 197198]|nr:RNA-directed DNA polymerase from mobile element jockey-like [Rhizophagus irregularis DAOM 181602=DAOM 197198]
MLTSTIFDAYDLHISDHNPIITYFDASLLSDAIKSARARQLGRNTRRIFKYDSISMDQWTAFADDLDKLCPIDPLVFDAWPLNQKCEYLHSRIIKAAKSQLPSVTVGNTYAPKKPKDLETLCQSYRFLSKVTKTIRSLRNNPVLYSVNFESKWSSYYIQNMTLLLRSLLLLKEKEFQASSIQAKIDARNENFTNDISTFIESALSRTRRRITLDRVFIDHPTCPTLLTSPDAIDQEVIEHFQHFVPITSTPPSSIQDLPERWSTAYAPLADVSPAIFDSLMDPPTLEEWSSTISSMPNDKAPGPSMISYEMLKHLGTSASALLFNLICACLSDANIPDLWRQAIVFPIPKPHEWKCQLKNTRPITLLEVIRKALVKLFYNRLAPLLASHHVLQGGNFAGLPGGSCRDPIITLESIIHDSVVTKQPLWILSQDISKAFDFVDLSMLRFALQRLRLPENATQFLLSLFMSRSNRVITAHGLTPPYRVKIGIDQGEVISPLLWVIYLDPLLTALKNEKKDPYCLVSPMASDLVSSNYRSLDVLEINNLVFMDDSTLISSSKDGMEHMLSITEEFYCLNNTSANHNKYVLATNAVATSRDLSPIAFNLMTSPLNTTTNITVTPIPMSSSFRFLGVWFNINGSRNFIRQQLKRECTSFSAILRPAKLTVQQVVLDWSHWSSLVIFKQDYFANTLASLLSTPFRLSRANLSSVPDLTYPNGHTPIYQCLSLDVFKANLIRLRKRSLFYLSQLLTPQGTHLLSWSVIYVNSIQKRGNARLPNWYKDLSANVTIPDIPGLLKDQFMTNQSLVSQIAKELAPCTPPSGYKKNWIVTMNDDDSPIFGKQIQLQPKHSTCIIVHWTSDCLSCPSDLITLRPCPGCSLNINKSLYSKKLVATSSVSCSYSASLNRSWILPMKKSSITSHTSSLTATVSWAEIMDFVTSTCNPSTRSVLDVDIPNITFNDADKALSTPRLLTAGEVAASSPVILSPDSHYSFYTDGSLINLGTCDVSMGWGWVQIVKDSGFLNSIATYKRVKAHSNFYWNDFADSLANTAHTSDDAVLISRLDLAAVHDYIMIYDDVICESNPRHLLKQYHQMLYMKDLLALSRFRFVSLLTDPSRYMVDWALTWHTLMFQPKFDNSFTKENVSKHHTLKFQLFLEDLPTLELLKRTRPDLYVEILTCRSCEDHLEDFMHLFLCKKRRVRLHQLLTSYLHHLTQKIKEAGDNASCDYSPLVDRITSLPCWSFSSSNWSSYSLVRGCLPTAFLEVFDTLGIPRLAAMNVDYGNMR